MLREDVNLALSKYAIPRVAVEQFYDNLKLGLYHRIIDNKVAESNRSGSYGDRTETESVSHNEINRRGER